MRQNKQSFHFAKFLASEQSPSYFSPAFTTIILFNMSTPMSPSKRVRLDTVEDPLDEVFGPKVANLREDELPLKLTVINHIRFLRGSYTSR